MTISEALHMAEQELKKSPTAKLDAVILLSHSLGTSKEQLILDRDNELQSEQEDHFMQYVQERKKGKPIAYITKKKEFFGRTFTVDERVLIPRPETEELVEVAITFLKKHPEITAIVDLGTGSACIAISLAHTFPHRQIIGLDVSPDALQVARHNRDAHQVSNLEFTESNLLSSLPSPLSGPIAIIANLPYIGTQTFSDVDQYTAKYEPKQALYAGPDGLDLYRQTWKQIRDRKIPVAALFMEIFPGQEAVIATEIPQLFPNAQLGFEKDLSQKIRIAVLEL